MDETKIRDEGNGILVIENSIAGVKSDTNRRIYCKNISKNKPYKYIGFDLPQGLSRDKKREHLIALHKALTDYSLSKQDSQDEVDNEVDDNE